MRVLFTGGGGAATEALWRQLAGAHEVHFADAREESIHPLVAHGFRHRILPARDKGFFDSIRALVEALEIDLLVPGVDEELVPLAIGRERLRPCEVLAPHLEFTRTMLDKLDSVQWLAANGLRNPRTHLLTSPGEGDAGPWIVKPRVGRGSRGVFQVHSPKELWALRRYLGPRASDYVCQELLAGEEYSIQVLSGFFGGTPTIAPVRIFAKRGITTDAVTNNDPIVRDECLRIHECASPVGVYNVQGMLTPDQDFVTFEINPRASTTLSLSLAAGFDFATLLDPTSETPAEVADGVRLTRYWSNHIQRDSVG